MRSSIINRNGFVNIFYINPNRIDWIDVAKGIAILLVIIGHTVQFGSATRNVIFLVSYAVVFHPVWVYISFGR